MMQGTAGAGIRELELQMRLCQQACPGTPERDARQRIVAQFTPWIVDDDGVVVIRHGTASMQMRECALKRLRQVSESFSWSPFAKLPASRTSNSGDGFNPYRTQERVRHGERGAATDESLGLRRRGPSKPTSQGGNEEPYINHLIEVVDLVASVEGGDMDVLIAALLHDALEDTRTGYDELAAAFGKRVARIVQENSDDMTLPKPERRRVRLAGISKKSREARLVKFADIISNLRAIVVSPPAGLNY